MRAIRKKWQSLLSNEKGQSTTEYILILAVVVMVAMKFKKEFEGRLTSAVGTLGGQIEEGLKSSSQ
jgi:hypothetical protein